MHLNLMRINFKMGTNSLQMREVPNGSITIDAQPCRKKLGGRFHLGLQTNITNLVEVQNPLISQLLQNEI